MGDYRVPDPVIGNNFFECLMQLPDRFVALAKEFKDSGFNLYIVGGAVRDSLLCHQVNEWDFATEATPNQTEKLLRRFGATNLAAVGKRFGTIAAKIDGEPVEITTFRSEKYLEYSRQPTATFGKTLREDLSRRDFTINAIAYDILHHKLIDPYEGQKDLKNKIIRAIGQPRNRFNEDPLRMIRGIRLAVQLDFTIEVATLGAIRIERERFGIISAERVSQEMDKILLANTPSRGVRLLVETKLIEYILPELISSIDIEFDPKEHKDIYEHILQVLDNTPARLELRWCALLHDIAKPLTRKKIDGEYHFPGHEVAGAKTARQVLERLRYAKSFTNYVSKLVYLHQRIPNYESTWTDGAVRRFIREAGDCLNDLFIFAEADSTGKNTRKLEQYRRLRQELSYRIEEINKQEKINKLRSPLDGVELMTIFKRPPGPWIAEIKNHLLHLVIEGELKESDKSEAVRIAKDLYRRLSKKR